jgi:pyridoxamine 5'-phosphate oxidase family protein
LPTCRRQAIFVLSWSRDGTDVARLGVGFGLSRAPADRYRGQGIVVPAAQAPSCATRWRRRGFTPGRTCVDVHVKEQNRPVFTQAELDYLAVQPIGRLATVSPDGQVQNNPTNFFVNDGTIVIGGHALGSSKKFRNVQRGSSVAFVVDDVATVDPWVPRGIEIRGTAVALTDHEPPLPYFSQEIIRITPVKIVTWGLDGSRVSRTV